MTTQEVANKLITLCREGKYEEVYLELFSPEIVSVEPEGGGWEPAKGLEAIRKKGQEWSEMVEKVYSSEISDPIVAENFFACTMKTKIKMKNSPEPFNMDEVCVYQVEDGKIIKEQFFYTPVPQNA